MASDKKKSTSSTASSKPASTPAPDPLKTILDFNDYEYASPQDLHALTTNALASLEADKHRFRLILAANNMNSSHVVESTPKGDITVADRILTIQASIDSIKGNFGHLILSQDNE